MATQTVTTSADIPQILEPYYTGDAGQGIQGLLPRAVEEFSNSYEDVYGKPLQEAGLYGADRVAGLSPYQQQVGTELGQMVTPEQFGAGTQYGTQAGNIYGGMSGFQAPTVGINSLTGQGVLNQYMSPYMQNVLDIQKQEAIRDAQKQQLGANLGAGRMGTFGGSRQLLAMTERERNLGQNLANIQATGLQKAYEQAAQQFNTENQLGLTAQQANQNAALQAAQQRLAAGQGLTNLAGTMGQLGVAQQAADIDRLKMLGAYGDLERGVQQQQIDADYQDLMRKLGWGQEQIGNASNILRGIPLNDTTQTTATPAPSLTSQMTGLGLTGLSLYNMLGK